MLSSLNHGRTGSDEVGMPPTEVCRSLQPRWPEAPRQPSCRGAVRTLMSDLLFPRVGVTPFRRCLLMALGVPDVAS